jgi:hypothetical protein
MIIVIAPLGLVALIALGWLILSADNADRVAQQAAVPAGVEADYSGQRLKSFLIGLVYIPGAIGVILWLLILASR